MSGDARRIAEAYIYSTEICEERHSRHRLCADCEFIGICVGMKKKISSDDGRC